MTRADRHIQIALVVLLLVVAVLSIAPMFSPYRPAPAAPPVNVNATPHTYNLVRSVRTSDTRWDDYVIDHDLSLSDCWDALPYAHATNVSYSCDIVR